MDLDVKTHKNCWDLSTVKDKDLPADGILDFSKLGLSAVSMRVRTGRNLKNYPLPGNMSKDDRIKMEVELKAVFDVLIANEAYGGEYVSITPDHKNFINEEKY